MGKGTYNLKYDYSKMSSKEVFEWSIYEFFDKYESFLKIAKEYGIRDEKTLQYLFALYKQKGTSVSCKSSVL